ncbi:hypothetical protein AB1484_18700 [Parafrankia sp. FMc6]|uniref:hypothetical protein n=1 Tax=Parafrankia soli TaxID=2599596 RepID=UPI0034D43646
MIPLASLADPAGLADLGRPVESVPGTAFRSVSGTAVAVLPDSLLLDLQSDGSPALLLTLIRAPGPAGPAPVSARLEIGLVVETPLNAVGEALRTQWIPARVEPADIERGVLQIIVNPQVSAQPQWLPSVELRPEMLTRARVEADLGADGAALADRLSRTDRLSRADAGPLRALLRLEFPALAPRLPLTVEFTPRRLAELLAERLGEEAGVSQATLVGTLGEFLADPVFTVTGHPGQPGDPGALDRELWAQSLALRVRDAVTAPDDSAAPGRRLRRAADLPQAPARIDLAETAHVIAEHCLSADLLAAARVVSGDRPPSWVRQVDAAVPPAGHLQVTAVADLPAPILDLLALSADLRVPAAPPARGEPVTVSIALAAPDWTSTAQLELAPGEPPPAGEVRLRALLASQDDLRREPLELAGAWLPVTGDRLLLGPGAFPLPLTVIRVSRALTEMAAVELRSASGRVLAELDAALPVIAVPRRPGPPASLLIRPRGAGRTIELPLAQVPRVELDLATLPGFGAHRARVVGRVPPGQPPLLVEWRPEAGSTPPRAVRLTSDEPDAEISWQAHSPFQPAVSWRASRGGHPTAWSAPVMPAENLVLHPPDQADAPAGPVPVEPVRTAPVMIDGLELRPDPADPSVWRYVPPGPFLDREPSGRLALGVVDAGPVSFLQLTSRLDLPDPARESLPSRLPAGRGRSPAAVLAEPVAVTRVAVETRPPDGAWSTVAEGTSSGIAPWTTALAAMLTAEQRDAVRAAVDGTRGRMRLVGELAAGGKALTQDRDVADLLRSS